MQCCMTSLEIGINSWGIRDGSICRKLAHLICCGNSVDAYFDQKRKKKVDASLLNYRNVQDRQVMVYMIQHLPHLHLLILSIQTKLDVNIVSAKDHNCLWLMLLENTSDF